MAFGCTGCRRFTVRDTTVTNVGYHVVDVEVEADTWTGDVTLLRNRFGNVYLSLLSATTGSGAALGPFDVEGNVQTEDAVVCQEPIAIGQPGFPYGSVTIKNNDLRSKDNGLRVIAASATITGNKVTVGFGGCGATTGAVVTAASGLVSGNLFPAAQPAVNPSGGVVVCGNSTGGAYVLPQPCS
jgi:hypothetical protein